MYEYLPTDLTLLKRSVQYESGCKLMFLTDFMFEHVYKPYIMCALQRECIAPIYQLGCKDLHDWNKFAGCHRFDQALINLLLINAYNSTLNTKTGHMFFKINRGPDGGSPKMCTHA